MNAFEFRESGQLAKQDSVLAFCLGGKVSNLVSGKHGLTSLAARAGRTTFIATESLDLIDWEQAYLQMLEYKEQKGLLNLAIRPETPKAILAITEPARLYTLIADDAVVNPTLFSQTALLQEACDVILRKYVDKFYRIYEERWDSENMLFGAPDENDPNFQDYEVKISRSETELIAAIQKLIDEADRVYTEELRDLPSIHFDRHLYQPLLIERGDKIRSQPPCLNESELGFVDDLRSYCRAEKSKSLAEKEVFLLRNLSRGKGIGFFRKAWLLPRLHSLD